MKDKIILLGSGELGKELVISLKRFGKYVIACDSYKGAPAMQVADEFEVLDMLNATQLDAVIAKHKPAFIIPEIESIRTDRFYDYEAMGITVVPSAKAANFTMNRKLIRDLAAKELGIKTANYTYADNEDDFKKAVMAIGMPCVVKPLMSSSGKGQSVIKSESDIESSWKYALAGSRGDLKEVIIEAFVNFHTEITLLTVTQRNAETLFCQPIGHRQERGDFMESWQPCHITSAQLEEARGMAKKVTSALGGAGIWGVEFFIGDDAVYFSELSPRPHDTGMVTLARTQNLTQFDLHARAILAYPIKNIEQEKNGVCAVILAESEKNELPVFTGLENALEEENSDVRIFGKPNTRMYRRMGVVLINAALDANMDKLRKKAKIVADKVKVN